MEILNKYRKNKLSECNLIVIDNFYDNPEDVRNFALTQEFKKDIYYPGKDSYYPGKRTEVIPIEELREKLQIIIEPFGGKITKFDNDLTDNSSFQYATSEDRSWIHSDSDFKWAGVIYLTPDAPLSSGTGFYRHITGAMDSYESTLLNISIDGKDNSKWELVDRVGNVFNRLILFNSKRFHTSMEYFGTDINNSRLFQILFFDTEY